MVSLKKSQNSSNKSKSKQLIIKNNITLKNNTNKKSKLYINNNDNILYLDDVEPTINKKHNTIFSSKVSVLL